MPRVIKEKIVPIAEDRIKKFENLAFGMFIHWGLYSQMGEGEWIKDRKPVPHEEYIKLMNSFTAKDFDAPAIARLAKNAGMKYITLTTRHHEGFSLYDTKGLSDFDAPHSPAGRDLIAEFVNACQAEEILPVFYHTTMDWHWKGLSTFTCSEEDFNEYLDYLHDSVEVLCTSYGKIGGLWFDGNWCRPELDWKLDRLYSTIRKHQPEAIIVNNTGIHHAGEIEHPEIDSVTFENQMASAINREGHSKYVAGEMCQTMNAHWGMGKLDLNYLSPAALIEYLAQCRKSGANFLLNIGPSPQGAIPEMEQAILKKIGIWTNLYKEAIYEGKPSTVKCQGKDFVLKKENKLYYFAHDLRIAGHGNVTIAVGGAGPRSLSRLDKKIKSVKWLDNGENLDFTQNQEQGFAAINLTGYPYGTHLVVRVAEMELVRE